MGETLLVLPIIHDFGPPFCVSVSSLTRFAFRETQVSFRSYWMRVILETIKEHRANISIKDISALTAIKTEDIVATLQPLNLIK